MNSIIKELTNNEKFKDYLKNIDKKISPINILGLTDVAKTLILNATKEESKKVVCLITYNELQAKKLLEDISYFTSKVVYFPKKEIVTYDYVAESKELLYERIEALNRINNGTVDIIVTTVENCMQKMISKKELYSNVIEFEFNKEYKFENIKEKLIRLGYERSEIIEGKGQFSVRGNIIDIAISNIKGVRVEFWGDEIDSIRYFNISSQRSTEELEKIKIFPAHEYLLTNKIDNICKNIEDNIITKNELQEEILDNDIDSIKTGNYLSKVDKYINCFYTKTVNFFDYLPENTIIFLDEIGKIKARTENIKNDSKLLIDALVEKNKIVPQILNDLNGYTELEENWEKNQIVLLEKQDMASNRPNMYRFNYKEINFYKSDIDLLINKTLESLSNKKKVIILSGNGANSKKLISLLGEKEIPHKYVENLNTKIEDGIAVISNGILSSGFECFDNNLVVITSEELFSGNKRRKSSNAFKQGEKVVFADLKIGDYVVHRTSGIGQFIGVNTIKTGDITKDYIKIRYKDDDILYVPTNSLDNVRKFIGAGDSEPKLNRLGSKEWEHTKAKVKSNLREVAKELIELYAKRKNARGFAFCKDTSWQKQFEDDFPYTETDDQLRCIEEVKQDMEKDMPMDRLLCGDVGYGKTEVAIRAAFKAVMDQKQVAYLVPTTVLANQQYETFKERMKNFPIRVEFLNRFKTPKEQKDIVKKLELGEIDVVIGTHRILSKDVIFKDLGLLIIDEEHRFGVKDKEKIKQLKTSVDVLTMTATPIPRTLHMSIVGIRDMSVIYEPPQNRKPVQTYVLEHDDEVIKEAITKEIERGGQVFYLFNNVEQIERKAEYIADLVPEAKIEYAHGQMSGKQLEEIMEKFILGNINVLVCTTILESGIDIPNANTIIVENADRLGLAQLYQIRGRVGRSNNQGYAYITYKRDKLLSEVADKRLKAIKEFTEFGSGFKIAMRDLEIRGAGSLLGEVQHGHMEQVGYDTYCNLLDEVVKSMQGIEVKEEKEIQIDLNVSCFIPDEYISNTSQKIEIYQNIAIAKSEEDISDVIDEITDRYGTMPKEVESLLEIAKIKMLCKKAGVFKISQKLKNIVFTFDINSFNPDVIDKLVENYKDKIKFSPGADPYITLRIKSESGKIILEEVKNFLNYL